MGEGATPELQPTPEQRIDAAITSTRYGQAGLGSLGTGQYLDSGAGGTGGQFVFADLPTLNTIIDRWQALLDRIAQRSGKIQRARELCNPPAGDMMSHSQADAAKATMQKKLDHNEAMRAYAEAYVQKLTASRNAIQATEHANADRLHNAGRDLGHA